MRGTSASSTIEIGLRDCAPGVASAAMPATSVAIAIRDERVVSALRRNQMVRLKPDTTFITYCGSVVGQAYIFSSPGDFSLVYERLVAYFSNHSISVFSLNS